LALNGSIAGGNSGQLTANGGILTLGGSNALSGGTTLNSGTLNLNNNGALGGGALTINGGTIDNTSPNGVMTVDGSQQWNSDFTFGGTQDLIFGGSVSASTNRQVTTTAHTLTLNGALTLATSGCGARRNSQLGNSIKQWSNCLSNSG
jgi:autotransporter-associated beta strand protein